VAEDLVPVFGGEVGGVQFDAELIGHLPGIGQVLFRRAVFGAVILLPVLHEQSDHLVALLLQQEGSDRGVDPAGHADDDALCEGGWHLL